jgi:hypothetical protein
MILPAWSTDRDPWLLIGAAGRPKRRFWICAPESPWVAVVADFERGGVLVVVVNAGNE